ncbi:Ig-like domain-containing protein [Brevibacillus fluminis]|uniref:Ig-like domain-containing protein n=1 Tax=Brevibacillus fluminis TaxID=511487 RepID=UPI003F8A6550
MRSRIMFGVLLVFCLIVQLIAPSSSHAKDDTIELQAWGKLKSELPVVTMSFSPDSKRLVSGHGNYGDTKVYLWDVENGKKIKEFEGKETSGYGVILSDVQLSPDGSILVATHTGSSSDTGNGIIVWDVKTGKLIQSKDFSADHVAFSPDGKMYVTSFESQLKFWDTLTGSELMSLEFPSNIRSIAFHPSNGTMAVSIDGSIMIRNYNTGKQITTLSTKSDSGKNGYYRENLNVTFSQNGKFLLTNDDYTENDLLAFYDIENNYTRMELVSGSFDNGALFSSLSDYVVATSRYKGTNIYSFPSGNLVATVDHDNDYNGKAAISADYQNLAIPNLYDIILYDATALNQKKLTGIRLSPSSLQIVEGEKAPVEVIGEYSDGSTEKIKKDVEWETSDFSVAIADKGYVYAKGTGSATVKVTYKKLQAELEVTVVDKNSNDQSIFSIAPKKSFTLQLSGGKSPYEIQTVGNGTVSVTVKKDTLTIKGLKEGRDTVFVKDVNGVQLSFQIVVTPYKLTFKK